MISRSQLANRLEEARYRFKRETKRSEIWKKRNSAHRIRFPKKKTFTELEVRSALSQAKLSGEQIEAFLRQVVDS